MPVFTVGLTGGVASGKTVVADFFSALGVPVVDADQVARDVVCPPSSALQQIQRQFGERFLNADGTLNRAQMRAHVFGDPAERRRLEAILHPLIFQELEQWQKGRTETYCLISAAILIESGMRRLVNRVMVVDVPVSVQYTRLVTRDGIDDALARGMLAAQMGREDRLKQADDVIDNAGRLESTRLQVERLDRVYRELSQARGR